MGWQPGKDNGTGSAPDPGLPGVAEPARDPRLPGFRKDGEWDTCRPTAALAAVLEAASGAEWRCPGATGDEMLGLLRQWQALESWAAAGKLGLLRSLIRDDDQPLPGGGYHGDLPDGWTKALTHEVALALSMPAVSAENLMWLAWNLEAMLPGTGELLAAGQLTLPKARVVDQALTLLAGPDAAMAEAMILPDLPGKTYGQVEKLAGQAAITVDPQSATRRREDAEQHRSRVEMSREPSGAAALSGRDLPTDQALAAHASICARAQVYKDSGAFPKDTRMDQFRAVAYLDMLNGTTAEARIASGHLVSFGCTGTAAADGVPAEEATAEGGAARGPEADTAPSPGANDDRGSDGPDTGGPDGEGPSGGGSQHGGPFGGGPAGSAAVSPVPRLADLVVPLATLLGLADRPGEGHGLGPLDPALCRELAAAAAASPHSLLCVTVTGPEGIATGHGCARPHRRKGGGVTKAGRVAEAASRNSPGESVDTTVRPGRARVPARPGEPHHYRGSPGGTVQTAGRRRPAGPASVDLYPGW